MSGSIKRRFKSSVDNAVVDDDEAEDEEETEEDSIRTREKREKKRRPPLFGYERGVRRVKRVVLFPIRKFQKPFERNRSSSSFSHVDSSSTSSLPRTSPEVGGYCRCLCMSQPEKMDSTGVDSPQKMSDSNEPVTSIEDCKVLIEKNDFYAKECNTHFSN
ncbi:hypothetical protein Ancab_026841 [Ancistrocladus abbreviatus]